MHNLCKENHKGVRECETKNGVDGFIFDIQRFSLNDGPGIRTTVFFKGCPLHCLWCSNPESQRRGQELLYYRDRCVACHRCVDACSNRANTAHETGTVVLDRAACHTCGECVRVCPAGARVISGSRVSVKEILHVVQSDSLFYRNSGGGVTFSGGEPLLQAEFILETVRELKKWGIHCVLDTSGYGSWEHLEPVLGFIDLLYWDVKCLNQEKHLALTGVSNDLIITNLEKTLRLGKKVVLRLPLVPGCNDSVEDMRQTGRFLRELGFTQVDVLPYHNLGISKYKALDISYGLASVQLYTREALERVIAPLTQEYGVSVRIV